MVEEPDDRGCAVVLAGDLVEGVQRRRPQLAQGDGQAALRCRVVRDAVEDAGVGGEGSADRLRSHRVGERPPAVRGQRRRAQQLGDTCEHQEPDIGQPFAAGERGERQLVSAEAAAKREASVV